MSRKSPVRLRSGGSSRLTDCQVRSMISRCESSAQMYQAQGRPKQARLSAAIAAEYREELAARKRGESVQEPQEDNRHVS